MKFILLIRENIDKIRSDEEMNSIIHLHRNWYRDMLAQNQVLDGNGISSEGALVFMTNNGLTVSEVKNRIDGIGGYYVIEADNLENAIEIAKQCPTFNQGDLIEVRPLM